MVLARIAILRRGITVNLGETGRAVSIASNNYSIPSNALTTLKLNGAAGDLDVSIYAMLLIHLDVYVEISARVHSIRSQ